MLSAEDFAAVRTAIEICNNTDLKKQMLCETGSYFGRYIETPYSKQFWNKIIENKVSLLLENLGLIKQMREKVTGIALLIGTRMRTWAVYHERTLDLSREFSSKFLNSSFFTSQGIIDTKKTAEELMKHKSLSIKQKYKLACIYCLKEHIPYLYEHVSKEEFSDDQGLQRINQLEIVKFWSNNLMGKIDELRGEKSLNEYMLEIAVRSGSKAAVEYCIEKTSLSRKKDAIIDAALEAVSNVTFIRILDDLDFFNSDQKYLERSLIPSDYFVDILCFLLLKMTGDEKIEFLKKDIEDGDKQKYTYYNPEDESWGMLDNPERSRVLEYLLHWPYQSYFMKTAELMWEILPEISYCYVLQRICDKLDPRVILKYGEEKTYDYRKLFREFWCQSPEHYKRYVLSVKESKKLLVQLFGLKNFTDEDLKNIELILESASVKEKEGIICSEEGIGICINLMKGEKWKILNEFVSYCVPSKEQAEFKSGLSFTTVAQSVCINFIRNHKWDAAEFFIKWSSLPENEIILLKSKMIGSEHGMDTCMDLFSCKGVETANKFCDWCFLSEEDVTEFKKELIFSVGIRGCAKLIIENKLEIVDEFINWALFSQEEITEFKKQLHYKKADDICEELISRNCIKGTYNDDNELEFKIEFQGGKWDQVEKYLTWLFLSEEEIRNFKKRLFKRSGEIIHFNLIRSNELEEAGAFLDWLEISPEEIKELKKITIWNYNVVTLYRNMCLDRHKAFVLLLRWCLTDKETVLEFRDHFKKGIEEMEIYGVYPFENTELSEEDRAVLEDFDSAIQQRLMDFDDEQRG